MRWFGGEEGQLNIKISVLERAMYIFIQKLGLRDEIKEMRSGLMPAWKQNFWVEGIMHCNYHHANTFGHHLDSVCEHCLWKQYHGNALSAGRSPLFPHDVIHRSPPIRAIFTGCDDGGQTAADACPVEPLITHTNHFVHASVHQKRLGDAHVQVQASHSPLIVNCSTVLPPLIAWLHL